MIGKKLYKPRPLEDLEYFNTAVWCNENNAYIVDQGEYYEVLAVPGPTEEEKRKIVKSIRDNYINSIEWRIDRYKDQVELGITPNDNQETYKKILEYMQYLRDYPNIVRYEWWKHNPKTWEEWLNSK